MIQCIQLAARQNEALRGSGDDDPHFIRHAAGCRDCADALFAMRALRHERESGVPRPREGAFSRAVLGAAAAGCGDRRIMGGFWAGLATGAVAAVVLVAVTLTVLPLGIESDQFVPQVTMALNQPSDVSIAIDAKEPMIDAEIHVMLHGAVDLYGYEGQRDVHWTTDLDRGTNELRLPVVVSGSPGGMLMVEVHHGGKRKSFQVEVRVGRAAT